MSEGWWSPAPPSRPQPGASLRPGLWPDPETRKPEPGLRSGDKHGIYQNTRALTNSWRSEEKVPGCLCLYKAGLAINCDVIISWPAPASPRWPGNTLQTSDFRLGRLKSHCRSDIDFLYFWRFLSCQLLSMLQRALTWSQLIRQCCWHNNITMMISLTLHWGQGWSSQGDYHHLSETLFLPACDSTDCTDISIYSPNARHNIGYDWITGAPDYPSPGGATGQCPA